VEAYFTGNHGILEMSSETRYVYMQVVVTVVGTTKTVRLASNYKDDAKYEGP
jgi:hypothetical protein